MIPLTKTLVLIRSPYAPECGYIAHTGGDFVHITPREIKQGQRLAKEKGFMMNKKQHDSIKLTDLGAALMNLMQ